MKTKKFFKKQSSLKSKYANIILCVILYLAFGFWLEKLAIENNSIIVMNLHMESSALRGITTQLQMLISVYLVLRENKEGYITAVLINVYSIFASVGFLIRNISISSLPGIISYLGVLLIITFLIKYKRETAEYIEKVENQKDILEKSEKKLHQMAFYDSLTALPNKDLFKSTLEQKIQIAKKNSLLIGVVFIDLDSFKTVNDTMGHTAGDYVLKQIASRLSLCLRKGDILSRFGGDEFIIQIADIEKVEELYRISNEIMDAWSEVKRASNISVISPSMNESSLYKVNPIL